MHFEGKVSNDIIELGCSHFERQISLYIRESLKIEDLNEKLRQIIENSNKKIIREKTQSPSKISSQCFVIPIN